MGNEGDRIGGKTRSKEEGLLGLSRIHEELSDLFYAHQAELLQRTYRKAWERFLEFEKGLRGHIQEEEQILLPLFRARATELRGGDPDLFPLEHKKLLEWLGRLKLRLSRLLEPNAGTKEALALLDDEAQFKKYLEQHALREERILYPELERLVDEREKAGLMRLLTFTLEGYGQEP